MRRHLTVLTLLILAALGAAACGDSSPTSPSSASSVTVNGNIVSFASGGSQNSSTSSVSSVTVPNGIRITIVGTNITVDVSGDGTFTLKNVPSGNVVLQITGPGVNATITLNDLQTGQLVTITVNVNGATAEVDSDRRSKGGEEQVEGRVESLPPTTPAGDFVVAGRTVRTDATTVIRRGDDSAGTFADLVLGYRVHVKGNTSGGVLVAREVKIQNTNTETGLNINGDVSLFTGTSAAFQFNVGTRVIKGDANTEFFGNSAFADLANGKRVEVKGSQRDGYVYATRIKVSK